MPEPPIDSPDEQELRVAIRELEARVSALERGAVLAPGKPPRQQSSNSIGLTLVNRIGALTLAIGVLFFLKYAADSGWIGPLARVIIGLLTGTALLGGSEWLDRRGQQVLSQGIAACGLATLYLSIYASYGFYDLLLAGAGFAFLLALCATVLFISVKRQNTAMAVLGLFGALLVPQLIPLAKPDSWRIAEAIFLLLLNLSALVIASKLNSRLLVPITAVLVTVAALIEVNSTKAWPFILLVLALAAAHFVYGRAGAYVIGHCLLAIAAVRTTAAAVQQTSTATTLISVLLAIYGIALLALGLTKRTVADRSLGFVFLGLVIAKLYLYDIWQLTYGSRIVAFVVLGILLLVASFVYSRSKSQPRL